MIENNEGLAQALEGMGYMHRALVSLRKRVLPVNPRNFAVYAGGPVDEIRKLEEQINEYSGRAAAEEHGSDVWLRLVGPPQDLPEVPASLLAALLEAMRTGVRAIAELVSAGRPAPLPAAELERACDLRIVAFRLSGPCIGFRVPDPGDYDGCEHEEPALVRQALGRLLQVAEWAGSDAPSEALESLCPDPRERRVILLALESLVPRPAWDVERLELSGRAAPRGRTIGLTRESHRRIDQAIDALAAAHVEVGDASALSAGRTERESDSVHSWSPSPAGTSG
jgi:hypothetical protein